MVRIRTDEGRNGKPLPIADAATRLLARRDHTARELEDKLLKRGYEPPETQAMVGRLIEMGYLDDRAVAERAVEESRRSRPRGRLLLERELSARGVPYDIIADVLSSYSPLMEENAARSALARRGIRQPLCLEDRARAWRTLARLGFTEPIMERICGTYDP